MAHDGTNRAFAVGVALNLIFVFIEAGAGLAAGSVALIADAGHNLSDVLTLLLGWGASLLATRAATSQRTYGFRKLTVIASLVSSIVLLLALGGIAWESLGRILDPDPVNGGLVIVIAAIGVVINTATASLFYAGGQTDLNLRAAFLHLAADAAISLGVLVAGVLILRYGWAWLDPVISLGIVLILLASSWHLLRESFDLVIDAVPSRIDGDAVRQLLDHETEIRAWTNLHIWPLSTAEAALTVHLVTDPGCDRDALLHRLREQLRLRFGLSHTTIQIEQWHSSPRHRTDRAASQGARTSAEPSLFEARSAYA
ncbi:cation diffusion facilitator family transporter [Halochromatium sp.]